ncbi:MAG TPA: phosphoribosylformylglycinamidine synthase subunit PurQ [Actinomycetes bacterium]|nr:phosphoribosylformylglycinamidine synthase subunit PurQ [Actinomycetes bacterium]
MWVGVVTFPGSCDDRDAQAAVELMGAEPVALWHGDRDLRGAEAVILPGGFSYGDYLRCGAIARFSPVMAAVADFAGAGGPVLGICSGFQVLCEAGLLPGALLRNAGLRFVCREVEVEVRSTGTFWTGRCEPGQRLVIPVKHGEGRYVHADPDRLAADGQVTFCYAPGHNPNGSLADIAGVSNRRGNVVGLMPHPEHAVDPLLGPSGGRVLFESLLSLAASPRRVAS